MGRDGFGNPTTPNLSHQFLSPLVLDHHNKVPTLVHSFNLNEEPPVSPDLSKKRKLPNQQGGLPLPKFKFRDRVCGLDDESSSEDVIEVDEDISSERIERREDKKIDNAPAVSAISTKDSKNFIGTYDTSMTLDVESKTSISSWEMCLRDQASTSSGSCNSNTFRNTLYSLDSRSIKNSNVNEKAVFESTEVVDETQVLPEFADHLEYEVFNTDQITSESESNEIMPLGDEKGEDLMLRSSAFALDASIPSSGRLDGNPVARKPTIDQEFEQYFSMLML